MLAAARAADMAANARNEQEEMAAVMAVMAEREAIQLAMMNLNLKRIAESHRDQERLPLRDGRDDYGRVEARIPKELFFHLMHQRNVGWEGLTSDEGMRDVLKAFPACRVKTVSGKTVVGYGARGAGREARGERRGAVFGRGTLVLAK
jgi:hypothetical protein